ncbi:MAG: LacI family transcriptional regulator [Proteobacteria bacterium]|nr:LacI family transcriptional regulator [Pseudomonadota bacterium]
MDTLEDDTGVRLAARLRREREGRGWSLADLAARSGVGKATISKIERGDASPTAGVLVRLAAAFDLTLASLLVRAEAGADRLIRAADQPVWRDPDTGYLRRQVFLRPDHPLEIVEVTMPPGKSAVLPAASYAFIRQVVWLTEGDLVVTDPDGRHVLAAGDCLGFGPPADVTISNESDAPARYIVALARS